MAVSVKLLGRVQFDGRRAWECEVGGLRHWQADVDEWPGKERSKVMPVAVKGRRMEPGGVSFVAPGSVLWIYDRNLYLANDDELEPDDVLALLNAVVNRRRIQLEKAHALQAMSRDLDKKAKREPIPQDVKVTVWQRDSGRCVQCGVQEELEFDHIIPLAMGGANTMRNLQLLCGPCNRRKGASLG